MKMVYLAGPISGCTYEECTEWRNNFAKWLIPGIACSSPMRDKSHLSKEVIINGSYENDVLSSSKGIMTRDYYDATHCDVMVVNFKYATRVSIGTVMEIAWAYQNKIPVVLIVNKEKNLYNHPMINEAVSFVVGNELEAAVVVSSVLGPYVN